MAETTITADPMDISIKGNGVVDMHHSQHHLKSSKHSQANQSFDESSPEQQTNSAPCIDQSALALAKSNYKNSNRNNNNNSPTNLSATNFRCERCDNFETSSRSTLLLHVVQCLSSPTRLKLEELDAENLIVNTGNVVVSHVEPPNNITNIGNNEIHCGLPNETLHNSNSQPNNNSSMNGGGSSSRKVFECDVCNMKFSNGANMRRHKMRHTGVKPYECRVCQKRFFRKDHLAEHFTTHTKTLPYHCPICNRGFQRQIAMRAHFQNEHVGQHDLVKTCPLCSYRAGSMKSLRIHFYNRHGIDLDNPGPGGSSSLLLALESQVSQAAAAAAAGFVPNLNAAAVASVVGNSGLSAPNHQSDSGESLRSTENSTPPMHFLTPHVEISMPENSGELFNGNSTVAGSETVEPKHKESDTMSPPAVTNQASLCTSPGLSQDQRMSCSTKFAPSSTINSLRLTASPKSNQYDNHIMPSISLIPIKQEPITEDFSCQQSNNLQEGNEEASVDNENDFFTTENKKMSSLIKISPLKSLLREDLKRRICAKANNRVTRNAAALENNNVIQSSSSTPISVLCNSTTSICNGTITSTGQETDSTMLNRKQILTCLFCGIEFPDETLYFLHKGCHCESNPWKCNICSEQCNNVYEFNSHLLSKSHQ